MPAESIFSGEWSTPFVGRQAEMSQLRGLLADPGVRLVTLVGPGGIGKTRLALELAASPAGFEHGVACLPLAALTLPGEFLPALAESLGLQLPLGSDLRRVLFDHLASLQMLLVLDNLEHLLELALTVRELLDAAPGIKVLVTSREKLGLQGEVLIHLQGLSLPVHETLADLENSDAVRLFVQKARQASPAFVMNENDLPAVARLCRLVDGLPLGLLLAAAWMESFSPAEIAERIGHDIDFLSQQIRDLPERQRSMRAVFDSSFARLAEQERAVFVKLSVFRAGFTEGAASVMAGAELPVLLALVRKSLLWRDPASGRYELHELLRQYAGEKLAAGELEALRAAHAAYFTGMLSAREAQITSSAQVAALDEIQADFENIRQAWSWIVGQRDFESARRCVRSLYAFCDMRSRYYEGEALFGLARRGLAPVFDEAPRPAWALSLLSWYDLLPFAERPEIFEETASQAQNCLSGARAANDAEGVACSLVLLGAVVGDRGEYQTAIGHYQQAMQLYPPLDDFYWVNMRIGLTYQLMKQYPDALRSFRASLARGKVLGERVKIGWSLLNLGDTLAMTGENVEAGNHLREALRLFEEIGTSVGIMWAKYSLARLALVEGKRQVAKQLADQAFALAEQTRFPTWTDKISAFLREIAPAPDQKITRPSLPEPLSERELEILQLLKSDLDGPEIARALTVSLNTVRFHTKNIYRKLQVESRREAVHRAEELGL